MLYKFYHKHQNIICVVIYAISETHFHLFNTYRLWIAPAIMLPSKLDLNSDLLCSMIYIYIYIYWTPIARSLCFEKPVCLIRIYKIFSEYKRRLISTHIYFSNVLLRIYSQKYRLLKFVEPETYCMLKL